LIFFEKLRILHTKKLQRMETLVVKDVLKIDENDLLYHTINKFMTII